MEIDLKPLEKWIYNEFRIDISAYKSSQMNRRLTSFLQRSGAASALEYIKLLDKDPVLRQKLKDYITINVSEFFRNKEIFKDFEEKVKDLLKVKKTLKIWSAACSNGAEPYSVAIILDRLSAGANHKIIATDIDATILDTARKGIYSPNDVRNVDKDILEKYFTYDSGKYHLCRKIKDMVQFKRHDLILDDYDRGYDIILCRNVVIYFTAETKDSIYRKLYNSLNPGGLLFVGATESIYNYREFGYEKVSTFIYKRKS